MAKDTQRDKARATFGKTFFENSKCPPAPKNSMSAQQKVANSRPIPTFKVGGVVKKDFTKPMMEAATRAAKKGTPVMKDGGVMEERLKARMKAGNYKDGGKAQGRYERKMKDIEKDFRIAMAKGKDADVAKAKMNQRIADAKDDLAKATKADRTATKAAEKAAERELTMTRRYGAAKPTESMKDKPIAAPKAMSDADMAAVSSMKPAGGLSAVSQKSAPKAAAPTRKPAAVPPRMQGRVAAAQATKASAQKAAPQQAPAAKSDQPVTLATAFAQTPAKKDSSAAAPAKKPMSAAEYRTQRAAELEAKAAKARQLETAPTGTQGAAWARLKNAVGFGSSGMMSQAKGLRNQNAAQETIAASRQKADAARAQQQAGRKADMLKRAAAERAAGREGNAKYYEREASYLNKGGMVGKYAAGGAGKVRKGMMKGK